MVVKAVKELEKDAPVAEERNTPSVHLTEEIRAALSAPLDPKFLRQREGQGGKTFTYADLDYLERRASEVDPDWGAPQGVPMFQVTDTSVVCNVMICSVSRSAVAGYYIPAEYEVSRWNPDTRKRETSVKSMDARTAHTITTAAQAAAERRVFAMFELGAELWAKNQEGVDEPIGPQDVAQPRQSSSGGYKEPSPAALKMLTDLGVPEDIARKLNAWGRGKNPKTGYPMSDSSEVIDALKEARGNAKGAVSAKVWTPIVAKYVSVKANNDDFDDDEDYA